MKKILVTLMAFTSLTIGCPGTAGGTEGEGEGETAEGEGEEGEGEGGGADVSFCQDGCANDAECIAGFVCDSETGTCVAEPNCSDNTDCLAVASGWTTACAANADCFGGTGACVDVDGSGPGTETLCATVPSEFFACDTIPNFAEVDVLDVEGETVTVCANDTNVCTDGFCTAGGDVPPPAGCEDDTACPAVVGFDKCLADGRCGCEVDADCDGSSTGDVCRDGFCTCSGNDVCDNGFVCAAAGTYDADDTDD
jgi:hypothetical protein